MTDAEGEERRNQTANRVAGKPASSPGRYLIARVPVLRKYSKRTIHLWRTYHVLVMNMKAGVMVASATPRRNLTVMRPP